MSQLQDDVLSLSLDDPETFWLRQADQLYWHKKPTRALAWRTKKLSSGITHSHWTWFPGGKISTSYNCIDRHVKNGSGTSTAIVWDSPVTGSQEKYTYDDLLREVETLGAVLLQEGVRKGDVVVVYSTS